MGIRLPDSPQIKELNRASARWAQRFGGTHLGIEHVTLALLEIDCVAALLLRELGVTVDATRDIVANAYPDDRGKLSMLSDDEALAAIGIDVAEVETAADEAFGARAVAPKFLAHTPALMTASMLAEDHAERLGHVEITPEHFLLAFIWQGADRFGGGGLLAQFASLPELRRRLLRAIEVEPAFRDAYIAQCENSERVASERATATRQKFDTAWVRSDDLESRAMALFQGGGMMALDGLEALERFRELAGAAGVSVIDNAGEHARSFWVVVNPLIRQSHIMFAGKSADGLLSSVGVKSLEKMPSWNSYDDWPRFPR